MTINNCLFYESSFWQGFPSGKAAGPERKGCKKEASIDSPYPRRFVMIDFVCDTCSAVKKPEEAWIVGHAAEAVGVVSARREVTIQSV